MRVSEIMTSGFETIDAVSSVTEAAKKMKLFDIGFLPVQEGKDLVGVLTDRDIVVRALAMEFDPDSTQAGDIATRDVIFCYEDISVEEAARMMEEHQIRRLIACDYDGNPVGIISLGDLAVKTRQDQLSGEALERISEPAAPAR